MESPYDLSRATPRHLSDHSPDRYPDAPPPSRRPQSLSQTYLALLRPRGKPWSLSKLVLSITGIGVVLGILVLASPPISVQGRARLFSAMIARPANVLEVEPIRMPLIAPAVAAAEAAEAPAEAKPRADATLDRKGRSPIAGGLLSVPASFASADGAYDLVIHFHGNTDLVEESLHASGLNAVVLIMNLGIGSAVYEDRFSYQGVLAEILNRTRTTMQKRGLHGAKLRRLALTAWSAGYGAIGRILEQPAMAQKVDAILLFDGPHVGFSTGTHELCPERLAPFERFAEQAAEGNKLFSITHSTIIPNGDYASTRETTDALLKHVGVARTPGGDVPRMPELAAMNGVLPKKSFRPLVPATEAHLRGLYVRGYAGDQAEHHIMHLVQMSETAVPDLVHYWATTTPG